MTAINQIKEKIFPYRDIEFYGKPISEVGAGTYGTVVLTDSKYVIKSMKNDERSTYSEISAVSNISSPMVVNYIDVVRTKRETKVIMDPADSDLNTLIYNDFNLINDLEKKEMIWQLIVGLAHITSKNIIHRDIKPANILVYKNNIFFNYQLKYADFGLSSNLECLNIYRAKNVYSHWWRPPEVVLEQKYNSKADVWALGCVIYHLWTGKHLFDHKENNINAIIDIYKKKINEIKVDDFHGIVDLDLIELLSKMLVIDQNERSQIFELQRNKFFDDLYSRSDYYSHYIIQDIYCLDRLKFNEPYYMDDMIKFGILHDIFLEHINSVISIRIPIRTTFLALMLLYHHVEKNLHLMETTNQVASLFLYNKESKIDYRDFLKILFRISLYIAFMVSDLDRTINIKTFFIGYDLKLINHQQKEILKSNNYNLYFTTPIDYILIKKNRENEAIILFSQRILFLVGSFEKRFQTRSPEKIARILIKISKFLFSMGKLKKKFVYMEIISFIEYIITSIETTSGKLFLMQNIPVKERDIIKNCLSYI